jgi:hypothetical protein
MLSSSASLRQKTHVPKPHNTGDNTCVPEKPASCEKTYRNSNSIATRGNELCDWIPTAVGTRNRTARRSSWHVVKRPTSEERRQPLQIRLVCGSVGFTLGERGHDAAELQDAEKAVAAGIATIGRKTQPAFHKDESAGFDAFAGDMLEIEIAAAGAVREALQNGSDTPGMKSPFAAMATPRAQTGRCECEIENSVAVRAKTIVTAALRTDHRYPESVAQDTEKRAGEQDWGDTERSRKWNSTP